MTPAQILALRHMLARGVGLQPAEHGGELPDNKPQPMPSLPDLLIELEK